MLSFATYSDSLATFYGSRDVTAMKRLYQDAAPVEQRLLARPALDAGDFAEDEVVVARAVTGPGAAMEDAHRAV